METRETIRWAKDEKDRVSSAAGAEQQTGALRDLLGESPALALDRILHLLSDAALARPGDEMAKLKLEVCHYAIQLRQELVKAQYELFVTRQRTADDAAATERLARTFEVESRETARVAAELEAHQAHVAELAALLAELD